MKTRKNLILFLVIFTMTIAGAYGAFAGTAYSDLSSKHWAYKNVTKMSEQGIVKGYPDGTFKPNSTVTYGEFIKMAVVSNTGKDNGPEKTGHWAESYYNEAVTLGYFVENDIPSSRLNSKIPRADMALIVSGTLANETLDTDKAKELETYLTDLAKAGERKDVVIRACGLGIITGYPNGTFKPEGTLTRAESATVINRMIDKNDRVYPEKKGEGKTVAVSSYISNSNEYEDLSYSKTAILDDASKYDMSLVSKNGYTGLKHIMKGSVYFIKDGKVVERTSTSGGDGIRMSAYDTDITKVDYIVAGMERMKEEVDIVIVPNPFKK